MRNNVLLLIGVLVLTVIVTGCGSPEFYGEEIKNKEITRIGDIITSPVAYRNKTVTVRGKIISECPTGCWVNVKEGNAVIYADFHPSEFAIPQKTGKKITMEGRVIVKFGKPSIIGKGVEIK